MYKYAIQIYLFYYGLIWIMEHTEQILYESTRSHIANMRVSFLLQFHISIYIHIRIQTILYHPPTPKKPKYIINTTTLLFLKISINILCMPGMYLYIQVHQTTIYIYFTYFCYIGMYTHTYLLDNDFM